MTPVTVSCERRVATWSFCHLLKTMASGDILLARAQN